MLFISVAFYMMIGIINLFLLSEAWMIVERNAANKKAEGYCRTNIYRAKPVHEAFDKSLWAEDLTSYRPHAELDIVVGGERYRVEINRYGFRCRDFEKEKPEGVYRIICIGGSTTV